MTVDVFRFSFPPDIRLEDAALNLQLASFAAEGLLGMVRVRIDFDFFVDVPHRAILVDGTTEVGATIVQAFMGLLIRDIGKHSFHVEPIPKQQHRRLDAANAPDWS